MFGSIRRKLLVGLGLVFLMLLTLSISGISGLISYRNVIHDLDYAINHAPHQTDLVAAVADLMPPVLLKPRTPEGFRQQQVDLADRLREARRRLRTFHRQLDEMPAAETLDSQKPVLASMLAQIEFRLNDLESLSQHPAAKPMPADLQRKLMDRTGNLLILTRSLPDPVEGMSRELDHARRVYKSALIIVSVASTFVLVLFFGLIQCVYRWIFVPIRTLHRGALRVAQGDFNFRVSLEASDEIAELAESFNQMTDRFQEIRTDLDNQVRERSQQLVRSERLADVGFLAAGVAHEINNPLSAILMAADSMEGRVDSSDESDRAVVKQYLQMIQRESERCRQITSKLLDFARRQDAGRMRTDVNSLVDEVLDMVRLMGKYRDRKIEYVRGQPCYLEVNGAEIKQVILNLVANALDSLEAGGTLQIDVVEQTDQVQIAFQDDGCGMTPDVLENLFEPFFTRKRTGQGTGLGLSISHRIVAQHGGTIVATSPGPGLGSTFTIRLPRQAKPAGVAA